LRRGGVIPSAQNEMGRRGVLEEVVIAIWGKIKGTNSYLGQRGIGPYEVGGHLGKSKGFRGGEGRLSYSARDS